MSAKYNSLEELRRKKALLKKDVAEMEDILTFDNVKESLSVFTNGFTDNFLEEKTDNEGDTKLSINTGSIVKQVANTVTGKVADKNHSLPFSLNNSGLKESMVENALKLGAVSFMGSYAKKNLYHSSWKKKIFGVALIYLVPILLRFLRKKLEEYNKDSRVSSLEQLI